MNRRDFNTSVTALIALPAIPIPSIAAAAPATAFPPASYLWADMIARARGHVDAGFLARRLGLAGPDAQSLLDQLVLDGVLKTPSVSGLAEAAKPFRFEAMSKAPAETLSETAKAHVKDLFKDVLEEDVPEDEEPDQG